MKRSSLSAIFLALSANLVWAAPTVYVPLGSGNMVAAIDAASGKIMATYSGVLNPHGLVATNDGEYLVAGSLMEDPAGLPENDTTKNSKLYIIHPDHGHVMSTVDVAGWTHHQAITPDSHYVISTHAMKGDISVLDMRSNKIIKRVKTGKVPNYALVSADGKFVYISNTASNTVTEIETAKWQVSRTFEAGDAPQHMAFSGDQAALFVNNPGTGKVIKIDIATGKISSTYELGPALHGLDIGDDGKTLFVSSKGANKLFAIDTDSGKIRSVDLGPAPYHLNTIRGSGEVYVSSRAKPVIWAIDQATLELKSTINLPAGEGHQMAIVN